MTAKSVSKKCSVSGCNREVDSVELCGMHYKRFWRHGSTEPLLNMGMGETPKDKFWSRVKIGGQDECWPWIAGLRSFGYGCVSVEGQSTGSHRAAWFYTHGYLPTLHILHSCDNPPCCNPNHLREGTPRDNSDDMLTRGRQAKGESNGQSVLTTSQVLEIRRRYANGGVSHRNLAGAFGVSKTTIHLIVHREIWTHI